MKNIKKIIAIGLLASSISIIPVINANAEWKQDSNQKWWNTEGNSWSIGWKEINGKWYYFGQDGYMLQNTTTPDGFKVDNNGVWIQNITTNTNSNNVNNTANSSTSVSNTSNSNSNNSSNSNVSNTVDNSNSGNTTLNNTGSITYNDNSKTTNNVDVTVDNTSKEEKSYYKNKNTELKSYYEDQLNKAKDDLSQAKIDLERVENQGTVQVYKKDANGQWGYVYEADTTKVNSAKQEVNRCESNVEYYEKLVKQQS